MPRRAAVGNPLLVTVPNPPHPCRPPLSAHRSTVCLHHLSHALHLVPGLTFLLLTCVHHLAHSCSFTFAHRRPLPTKKKASSLRAGRFLGHVRLVLGLEQCIAPGAHVASHYCSKHLYSRRTSHKGGRGGLHGGPQKGTPISQNL